MRQAERVGLPLLARYARHITSKTRRRGQHATPEQHPGAKHGLENDTLAHLRMADPPLRITDRHFSNRAVAQSEEQLRKEGVASAGDSVEWDVPERVNAVGAKPARTVDASQSATNAKIAVCRKPLGTSYCKPAIVADPYPRSVRLVRTSTRASFAPERTHDVGGTVGRVVVHNHTVLGLFQFDHKSVREGCGMGAFFLSRPRKPVWTARRASKGAAIRLATIDRFLGFFPVLAP
jgi:hypothetical protein